MNTPTRRSALQFAAATGAGAVTAAVAGSRKPRRKEVTTFVFVSGSNGVASVDPELTMRGHRTVGVTLPGHGPEEQFHVAYQAPQDLETLAKLPSPVAAVTLDDYVEATVNVVRRVAEYGPVILVGGSLGGATITKTADEVPDLIDRLVYSSAICCTNLPTPNDYVNTPEGRESLTPILLDGIVGDPRVIKAIRINWRTGNRKFLDAAKKTFMEDATDGEFLAMLNTLLPDESMLVTGADARGSKQRWGRVPRVYIRHTKDRAIPLALQDRMIREADAATPRNTFEVFSVDATHAPTAKAYRQITEILHRLAK
ncbi:alpha/beta fold hydrolase [Nonomuraea terrae]|uniref:Alpha/beta fold hydrolase n=1 Tax=Nonomuraea terrae TaxID=2530383 RepID=A0A4R4YRE0_9ACTN|nr:alpha/beta fold hydrolase [Nonomuraea terrae]TDD47753.1 alpha/beta fold hydrolase [Nonomuraea terrae]